MTPKGHGRLVRVGPLNRGVSPHVVCALSPQERKLLHVLLLDGISYVRSPRFGRSDIAVVEPSSVTGMAGLGAMETPAFLWMNYCKWMVHQSVKDSERPMGIRLGKSVSRWMVRAEEMRAVLVESNMALAKARAAQLCVESVELDDWFQEAAVRLDVCVLRFDADRKWRFGTYYCCSLRNLRSRLEFRSKRTEARDAIVQKEQMERQQKAIANRQNGTCAREANAAIKEMMESGVLTHAERTVVRMVHGLGSNPMPMSRVARVLGRSVANTQLIADSAMIKLRTHFT